MLLPTILLQITPPAAPKIPLIDLAFEAERQIVVDREAGQYLGHPTTCLLDDGQTVLCVYPKGHGKGGIVFKRSTDGGMTWSDRLPTPENWATSREVPTLHRIDGPLHAEKIPCLSQRPGAIRNDSCKSVPTPPYRPGSLGT